MVLLQDDKPICFPSRSLTETVRRYANKERELLAVIYGCTKLHRHGKDLILADTFSRDASLNEIHRKHEETKEVSIYFMKFTPRTETKLYIGS